MVKFTPFLACVLAVGAQDRISITPRARPSPTTAARTPNLRYDVRLVQIPVVVTDPRGKPVVDLPRENFRLFEDDVERQISSFTTDDAPISAILIFDSSRSMKPRIADARAAVDQFLQRSLPGDEYALVRFSDRAEVLNSFTSDLEEISRQLASVEPRGWTALFDALCLGTHQVRKGRNQRKVMVVFSDGADNNSRYSQSELTSLLREADVEVYAISLFEKPRVLERLTEETGGRALWVRKLEDLPEAMETLNRQIRSEYMIGYNPGTIQNDGKYHRIRVEVAPPAGTPKVRASWRRGYTAPGE
jgi:VWFA-related protein